MYVDKIYDNILRDEVWKFVQPIASMRRFLAAAFGISVFYGAAHATDTSGIREQIRALQDQTRILEADIAANEARIAAAKQLSILFKAHPNEVLNAQSEARKTLSREPIPAEILTKFRKLYPRLGEHPPSQADR